MASDPKKYLGEIATVSFGKIIASVGEGVAQAQAALDEGSLAATLDLYDIDTSASSSAPTADEIERRKQILRSVGYNPSFYALRNVHGKIKMALSFSAIETSETKSNLFGTMVNATTQNKYNFGGEASSEISFEIVPVPSDGQIRRVPELAGKLLQDVVPILEEMGLSTEFLNSDETAVEYDPNLKVSKTIPEAGAYAAVDDTVRIIVN